MMLIEIEGNELVGKTTLCHAIQSILGKDKCVIVKQPNLGTDIGIAAASIIDARKYSDMTQFLAVVADFAYAKETIMDPAIKGWESCATRPRSRVYRSLSIRCQT